ncbi:phospholipase D-like domain-containing protein [Neisseriaceae bacterium TC5R-5]|nr:phospholipase D-like domain-containing protein [Neisseriaceae bacterium TC5R-5]
MTYRDIYIHSKLMLVDDVCMTLGSANMNQRSMCVDSELNVACNDEAAVSEARARVFKLHSGGTISGNIKNRSVRNAPQQTMRKAFDAWTNLMKNNAKKRGKGEKMIGFLLPFKELRESDSRHG